MRNLIAILLVGMPFATLRSTSATLRTSVYRKRYAFNLRSCIRCNKRLCSTVFKRFRRKCIRKKWSSKKKKACIRKHRKKRSRCIKFLFLIHKCLKKCIRRFKLPLPTRKAPPISSKPSAAPSVTPSFTPSKKAQPSATVRHTIEESKAKCNTISHSVEKSKPSLSPSSTPSRSPQPSATPSITPSPSALSGDTQLCECKVMETDNIQLFSICSSMISGSRVTGIAFNVVVGRRRKHCILDLTFTQEQLSQEGLDCQKCPTRESLDSCVDRVRQLLVYRCF